MDYKLLKKEIFSEFSKLSIDKILEVKNSKSTKGQKTKIVQSIIDNAKNNITITIPNRYPQIQKTKLFMLIQYCYSVVSFEYRHMVWPYEYMAFSRRNGELWERFCKSAWDNSEREHLHRISAPKFSAVEKQFTKKIHEIVNDEKTFSAVNTVLKDIFELVGEINMAEDEMFSLEGVNHIIDFKSGFGSNEKGNTLRLLAVGKAYKHWDENVELLFLVRQNDNNNYLEKIKKSNLWNVHCGDSAYDKIDELTNSGISEIRKEAINFREDLSNEFWKYLESNELAHYLEW
ncbi:hypothetical protein VO71_19915 [Aeromonas salmonicida subsp. smithia]|uniref:hypothetical protein n=1 Tax=Aeromonas salmonicida TaxID=645 RepID=UPI000730B357|nr:hypothetical protein [Aeromonas salmonicida]KTA88397.1 hypothetical protein VO71_19915 [Aeromonas salmonicida subsp. smithia]